MVHCHHLWRANHITLKHYLYTYHQRRKSLFLNPTNLTWHYQTEETDRVAQKQYNYSHKICMKKKSANNSLDLYARRYRLFLFNKWRTWLDHVLPLAGRNGAFPRERGRLLMLPRLPPHRRLLHKLASSVVKFLHNEQCCHIYNDRAAWWFATLPRL